MHRLYFYFKVFYYLFKSSLAAVRAKRRIFLMSTPWHGNLGDQAIILAEYQLLKKVFPDYTIIEYPTLVIQMIRKITPFQPAMQGDDIIALHGGGNLGSLYPMEEDVHRWVISKYSHQRIIFMPQSLFFSDDQEGKEELHKSQIIYGKARDLTIFERDEVSHNYGKNIFPTVHHQLVPDTVTSLGCEDVLKENVTRNGICFFMRSDKEKVVSDSLVDQLKKWLHEHNISYVFSDTVIQEEIRSNIDRWKAVRKKLQLARQSRLVITDRYHGLIFSVITHSPVIVFKSYDTKISSGVVWFKGLPWVHYAEKMSVNEIEKLIHYYCDNEEKKIDKFSSCGEKLLASLQKWSRKV